MKRRSAVQTVVSPGFPRRLRETEDKIGDLLEEIAKEAGGIVRITEGYVSSGEMGERSFRLTLEIESEG